MGAYNPHPESETSTLKAAINLEPDAFKVQHAAVAENDDQDSLDLASKSAGETQEATT